MQHSKHADPKHGVNGKAPSLVEPLPRVNIDNSQQRLRTKSVSPGNPPTVMITSEEASGTTLPVQDAVTDPSVRPSRGRRPPTPYHPPSDLALSEISESAVSDRTQHQPVSHFGMPPVVVLRTMLTWLIPGQTSKPGEANENSTVAEVRPRTRYPLPLSRHVEHSVKVTAEPNTKPTRRPHSHHSTESAKVTDPFLAFRQENRSEIKPLKAPSLPPTDHSSFPPLSTNPRDMTVFPEDSISRVIPVQHTARERRERPDDEGRRGRAPDRQADRNYSRRREHPRSRRRSLERRSDSNSGSDQSSTTSVSQPPSARSSPQVEAYRRQTLSPPMPSRRPSLGNPPFRMASPATSNIRPSVSSGFPYMAQPLPMSPISPLPPPMHPLHFNAPSMSSHPWSIPPSYSSVNLSSHSPMFAQQWQPYRGTPSQMSLGAHPYSPPMQSYFNGMPLQGLQAGPSSLQRRASAISAGGGMISTSAAVRQPPLPSRSGSMPLPVRVPTGIAKDR